MTTFQNTKYYQTPTFVAFYVESVEENKENLGLFQKEFNFQITKI